MIAGQESASDKGLGGLKMENLFSIHDSAASASTPPWQKSFKPPRTFKPGAIHPVVSAEI
jgi:hypothetical protein